MSNRTSVIASIAVLLFVAKFGTVSAASAANVSAAAEHSLTGNAIMLAYGASETDEKSQQGHGGDSGKDHGKCGNMMSKIDSDNDGKISKKEFLNYHEKKFEKKDLNNDGFIDKDEMQKMMEKHMHGHDYHGKKEMGDKAHGHGDMKE